MFFFFASRRRHTRWTGDWSSDVCSSDLSRLADELAAGMSATVRILRGQPRGFGDSSTFSPAAAIVSELACIEPTDPPEAIRRCLRELVETSGVQGNLDRTVEW